MKIKKAFPTLGVLGVSTGYLLETGGFGKIHDVLDHLYPGIMTAGCAEMAYDAMAEILRQHPELGGVVVLSDNYEQVAQDALAKFGDTIEVEGPVHDA